MTFSLIITVYNNLKGIQVLEKDLNIYKRFFDEIIIIDDHSTDGSWEALKKCHSKKIIIKQNIYNSGRPSEPRNLGINLASKEFITFLDIGDSISEDYLNFTLNHIRNNKSNIYSGIKTTYKSSSFPHISNKSKPFFINISKYILNYKNFTLLSGLTLSLKHARIKKFKKVFFEDWIFVQELLKENLKCILVFSPIFYQTGYTNISKGKVRQISRFNIFERGFLKFILYVFFSVIKYSIEKIFKFLINAK